MGDALMARCGSSRSLSSIEVVSGRLLLTFCLSSSGLPVSESMTTLQALLSGTLHVVNQCLKFGVECGERDVRFGLIHTQGAFCPSTLVTISLMVSAAPFSLRFY